MLKKKLLCGNTSRDRKILPAPAHRQIAVSALELRTSRIFVRFSRRLVRYSILRPKSSSTPSFLNARKESPWAIRQPLLFHYRAYRRILSCRAVRTRGKTKLLPFNRAASIKLGLSLIPAHATIQPPAPPAEISRFSSQNAGTSPRLLPTVRSLSGSHPCRFNRQIRTFSMPGRPIRIPSPSHSHLSRARRLPSPTRAGVTLPCSFACLASSVIPVRAIHISRGTSREYSRRLTSPSSSPSPTPLNPPPLSDGVSAVATIELSCLHPRHKSRTCVAPPHLHQDSRLDG